MDYSNRRDEQRPFEGVTMRTTGEAAPVAVQTVDVALEQYEMALHRMAVKMASDAYRAYLRAVPTTP